MPRFPTSRLIALVLLTLVLLCSNTLAQTGGMLPKAAEINHGETYAGAPVGDSIDGIDLRKYFPPVGSQSMNDCTAWAVSAAKSCLEAMDQQWDPTRPQTMFSPAFIYPQINNGKDEGSSLVAAALLLENLGAATLKTTPYKPKDFSTQPSEFAFTEALRFKNRGTYILENRELIKVALRENLPVIIGARLTPLFFSGTAESYTSAMHAEGMLLRKPDQPHAMHAMVIVGYDDQLGRFLLRNSWGEDWGRAGYCWVDYSCFDSIDASASAETFLFVALAMEDEALDVEATPDIGDDLKLAVSIGLRGEPIGYDRDQAATKYRVNLELRGPNQALDLVDKVTWMVPDAKGVTMELQAVDVSHRFRVLTVVTGDVQPVVAQVHFLDGTSRALSETTAFHPPLAEERTLSLSYEDLYWGESPNWPSEQAGHSWERKIQVNGALSDRRSIASYSIDVGEQHFEETLKRPGDTPEDQTFTIFKPEPITATFRFEDGTQLILKEDAEPIEDPANDLIFIESELHPIGDGKMSAFRAFLRVPGEVISFNGTSGFDRVVWEVDGSQDHRNLVLHFGAWNRYELTGTAMRDFHVRATLYFDKRDPIVVEKWIELPDEGTAYVTPERIDIWDRSSYQGRNSNDTPTWRFDARVSGDWVDVDKIKEVTFSYTNLLGEAVNSTAEKDSNGDWQSALFGLHREADVTVTVQWLDASRPATILEKHLTSNMPVVDGIFLESQSYREWGNGFAWSGRLGGPEWNESVHILEYLYDARFDRVAAGKDKYAQARSPWQTVLSAADGTLYDRGQIFRVAPRAGVLRARAHYQDGSMESFETALEAELSAEMSGPPENPIRLRLLERFLGADAATPFQFELWLDAQSAALDKVDHMLLFKQGEDLASAEKVDAKKHFKKGCWSPGRYRLRLMMMDGTFDERQFEVSCLPVRDHELSLRRSNFQIAVVGPAARLDEIKKLTFEVTDEKGQTDTLPGQDYLEGRYDNAILWLQEGPVTVVAKLEFEDGSTASIEERLTLPESGSPELVTEDRFWGFDEGKPYWLIHHRLLWAGFVDGRLSEEMNHPGHTRAKVLSWPDFEVMEVSLADKVGPWRRTRVNIIFSDGGWIDLPELKLFEYKVKAPVTSALTIKAERTWENPDPSEFAADEWLFRLDGPIQMLDEIDHVDYMPIYASGDNFLGFTWHAWQRYSLDGDGFPGMVFSQWLQMLTAKVYFVDERPPLELRWKRP